MWDDLRQDDNEALITLLEDRLASGETVVLSRRDLALAAEVSEQGVAATMGGLVERHVATPIELHRCAVCGRDVPDPGGEACREIDCEAGLDGAEWIERMPAWRCQGVRRRDPAWLFAIHGMTTLGSWQEEFGWQFAIATRRSIPCHVYKYGFVVLPAVWPFLRARYVKRLANNLRSLSARCGGPPDVLAHSLGTWLISHALRHDPDLKVGRIILTGCILRPDFAWTELIERGQVEAVLCHRAGADMPVAAAHYCIHDAGPSGRIGFPGDPAVVHLHEPEFGHSTFFEPDQLSRQISDAWTPFLTDPAPGLNAPSDARPARASWRASRLRWITLVAIWVLSVPLIVGIILYHGLRSLWGEWAGTPLRGEEVDRTT